MPATQPRAIIVAGPNESKKTTFAREFLLVKAQCPVFVNADLLASGLSPFAPKAAAMKVGRIMLAEIDDHLAHRWNIRGHIPTSNHSQSSGSRMSRIVAQAHWE